MPDVDLGEFIEEVILQGKSKRRSKSGHPYREESGTAKDKQRFCEYAIGCMTGVGQVSAGAIDLVKRLFAFIASNNPTGPVPTGQA